MELLGRADLGVGQRRQPAHAWHRVNQDVLALAVKFWGEDADAGGIAAGPPSLPRAGSRRMNDRTSASVASLVLKLGVNQSMEEFERTFKEDRIRLSHILINNESAPDRV